MSDTNTNQHCLIHEVLQERDELLKALKNLRGDYVNLMEAGMYRLAENGYICDPLDVMLRRDPALRQVDAVINRIENRNNHENQNKSKELL